MSHPRTHAAGECDVHVARSATDPITAPHDALLTLGPFIARPATDPITEPHDALLRFGPFIARPIRHESFGLLLDERWRATAIVHHGRSHDPDAVFDLAAEVCAAAQPHDRAVILLTVRPHRPAAPTDAERWGVLDDLFHGCGLDVVEWFVDGRSLDLPRARAGVASRWPPSAGARPRGSHRRPDLS